MVHVEYLLVVRRLNKVGNHCGKLIIFQERGHNSHIAIDRNLSLAYSMNSQIGGVGERFIGVALGYGIMVSRKKIEMFFCQNQRFKEINRQKKEL